MACAAVIAGGLPGPAESASRGWLVELILSEWQDALLWQTEPRWLSFMFESLNFDEFEFESQSNPPWKDGV